MRQLIKISLLISGFLVGVLTLLLVLRGEVAASLTGKITFVVSNGYRNSSFHVISQDGSFENVLWFYHGAFDYDWSPRLKLLAITDGDVSSANIHIVSLNTQTNVSAIPAISSDPRWSPNSATLAYQIDNGTAHGFCVTSVPPTIQTYRIAGDPYIDRRIKNDWCIGYTEIDVKNPFNPIEGDAFLGGWSPDGRQIMFSDIFDTYLINRNATGFHKLQNPAGSIAEAVWSPDNRYMAEVIDGSKTREVCMAKPDGSDPRCFSSTSGSLSSLIWSPDSRQLMFESQLPNLSYDYTKPESIYTINADGTNQQRLTTDNLYTDVPIWSPDGKQIAFLVKPPADDVDKELYVMNADGTGQQQLTSDKMFVHSLAWSSDSSQIAFTVDDPGRITNSTTPKRGDAGLYVIALDRKTEYRMLTHDASTFYSDPFWW